MHLARPLQTSLPAMVTLQSSIGVESSDFSGLAVPLRRRLLGRDVERVRQSSNRNSSDSIKGDCCEFEESPAEDDRVIRNRVQHALSASGYSLENIHCTANHDTICLQGFVHRYFDLQMAIATVRRLKTNRQIELQVQVLASRPHTGDVREISRRMAE